MKNKVISAASIIAKVFRDNLMIKLADKFSYYSWKVTLVMELGSFRRLKKFGITSHHRKGFKPVHKILSNKNLKHKRIHFFIKNV